MDPSYKSGKRSYVVLVFVDVNPEYCELETKRRAELTKPHIDELEVHLKDVSLMP